MSSARLDQVRVSDRPTSFGPWPGRRQGQPRDDRPALCSGCAALHHSLAAPHAVLPVDGTTSAKRRACAASAPVLGSCGGSCLVRRDSLVGGVLDRSRGGPGGGWVVARRGGHPESRVLAARAHRRSADHHTAACGAAQRFPTPPSARPPESIALAYVRDHRELFRLDRRELAALRLTRRYTDLYGITHLSWEQQVDGVPVFEHGLLANVSRDGRLINVLGAPVAELPAHAPRPAGTYLVPTPAGLRPATPTARGSHRDLVDTATGALLRSVDTVAGASGSVWEYLPNVDLICPSCAPAGGQQASHTFPVAWATPSNRLAGAFAHVYTDVNDDNALDAGIVGCAICGEIHPAPPTRGNPIHRKPGRHIRQLRRRLPSVFLGLNDGLQLDGEPAPERDTGLLVREHVPRLAGGRPVRVHGRVRRLRRGRRDQRRGIQRRHRGQRVPRREPPQHRNHVDRAGRHPSTHADVPVGRDGIRQQAGGQRRRRRVDRLPRVHARARRAPHNGRQREPLDRGRAAESDERGLGRLVCARLPRRERPRRG